MTPPALVPLLLSCIAASDLVPPTVVDDPDLPSVALTVAGQRRRVHVREYGDPEAPTVLILPGSVSDIRVWEVVAELSDQLHLVMWDGRGNGLSERCEADELDPADMVEEIEAMRQLYAPDEQVHVIGHSWSALFMAMYLAVDGAHVDRAVLIEPNGFHSDFQAAAGLSLNLLAPGYLDLAWSADGLTPDDHATLDYAAPGMIQSGVRRFSCDPDDPPPWPVWRAGGLALAVWEASILDGARLSFDFTEGMSDHEGPVLFIGTECSPIGVDFQAQGNMTVFPGATQVEIADSGHRLLTEQPDALIAALRAFLEAP